MKMRYILNRLMEISGHKPGDIFQKTGVHPSTLSRFFTNPNAELKSGTVRKIAEFYGISESQLRGDMPIDGIEMPGEENKSAEEITPDELYLIGNMRNLSTRVRGIIHNLAEALVEEAQSPYQYDYQERRKQNVNPNRQLRAGENHYQTNTPVKRRLRDHNDGRKNNIRPSKSQLA